MQILKVGSKDKGRDGPVHRLQKLLNDILGVGIGQDGIYGKATFKAVVTLQKKFNKWLVGSGYQKIGVDGIWGPETKGAYDLLFGPSASSRYADVEYVSFRDSCGSWA